MAKTLPTDPSTQPLAGTTLWILSTSRMRKRSSPFFLISKAGIFKFAVALYGKYFVIRCRSAMTLDGNYKPVLSLHPGTQGTFLLSLAPGPPAPGVEYTLWKCSLLCPLFTLPGIPIPAARHCVLWLDVDKEPHLQDSQRLLSYCNFKRDLTKAARTSWAEIRMSPEFNGSSSSDGFYGPFLL